MNCSKCKYENHNLATYCSNCGQKINTEKVADYNIPIKKISFFFFALLAYIILLHFTDFCDSYISLLIADTFFGIIVLFFFARNYKSTSRLFKFRKFNYRLMIKILLIAPFIAVVVHFAADFLNQSVLNKSDFIYYNQFKNSPAPLLFSILSISVFPAIFEEIAFRGILFDQSFNIAGLKPTIFITSILFTIMHLSLLSVFWIFPIGLYFGYLRARYGTLLYGMIGHFTYNSSIVLLQIILL